jgi:hypothetical protein
MSGGLPAAHWAEEQSAKFTALQAKAQQQGQGSGSDA